MIWVSGCCQILFSSFKSLTISERYTIYFGHFHMHTHTHPVHLSHLFPPSPKVHLQFSCQLFCYVPFFFFWKFYCFSLQWIYVSSIQTQWLRVELRDRAHLVSMYAGARLDPPPHQTIIINKWSLWRLSSIECQLHTTQFILKIRSFFWWQVHYTPASKLVWVLTHLHLLTFKVS